MSTGRAALASLTLALALTIGPAVPASADAPVPTDFRSEVQEVDPALPDGVTVTVVGGDSFLEVQAQGHRVEVPDYGDATVYLRFEPNGTVQRNRLAIATSANEDRFGASDVEPDPDAAPDWETVSTDGRFAWHDHRIHWMSPTTPTAVDDDGRVDLGGPNGRWQVPLVVDDTEVTVTGQLWLEPTPSWWPSLLIGAAMALGVVLVGRRSRRASAAIGLVAAASAVGVSAGTASALPAGISGSWVPFAVSGIAVVAGAVALRAAGTALMVAQVALASALVGWGLGRSDVLVRAVLPTTLPPGLDRAVTVAALAVGVATGLLALSAPPHRSSRTAVSGLEPHTP